MRGTSTPSRSTPRSSRRSSSASPALPTSTSSAGMPSASRYPGSRFASSRTSPSTARRRSCVGCSTTRACRSCAPTSSSSSTSPGNGRVCAPSTALGAYWGAWYEFVLVRRLDATAFAPPPGTDAGLLRIARRPEPLVPPADAAAYRALVSRAFERGAPLRRTLRGSVSPLELKRLGRELGFAPDAPPWELDQHQWAGVHRFVREKLSSRRPGSSSAPLARLPRDTESFNPVPRGRKGVG